MGIVYTIGNVKEETLWKVEFELSRKRRVRERIRRGLIRTYKPVIDDAPYRVFSTMREYNDWCEKALPSWLGYAKAA